MLRTDFKNDIFSGNRKYRMVDNGDGTFSFEDVTTYSQEGDMFGATEINATNAKVNENENAIAGKAPSVHKHTKSQITDFPTAMPASDVPSWAKAATKPNYNASEVGALAVNGKAVSAGTADNATNANNSDKIDNYHVQVVASVPASTVANTIYFVTE